MGCKRESGSEPSRILFFHHPIKAPCFLSPYYSLVYLGHRWFSSSSLHQSSTNLSKMSYVAKDKDVDASAPAAKIHKIRITLTSRNVKNLEKGKLRPTSDSIHIAV